MNQILVGALALALAGTGSLIGSQVTEAAATTVDLSTTGSIFANLTAAQPGQEVVFSFTVRNNSSTRAADLAVTYSLTNATRDSGGYICPLIRNHFDINPDGSSCEPGSLAPGKAETVGLVVTPKKEGTTTVRACASNLAKAADPASGNNCKTLHLAIR